jgi:hypothetical protein
MRNDAPSDTPRLIDDVRGVRYGEAIAVFARNGHFEAEVFGTQFLNDCPQELWDALDPSAIAADLGALAVKLNGPRHWVIDGIGQKVNTMEPVLREFNGLLMRRLAVVDLGDTPSTSPYTDNHVHRGAVFFFDSGKPVYELIAPDGVAYVMQAYCLAVDPTTNEEGLLTLGERLAPPEGWTYRVRTLEDELVIDTTHKVATVLQDEFEHSYTLPE